MFMLLRDYCRDKTSLAIIWLKDKSLAGLDNLPDPDIIGRGDSGKFGECGGEF